MLKFAVKSQSVGVGGKVHCLFHNLLCWETKVESI